MIRGLWFKVKEWTFDVRRLRIFASLRMTPAKFVTLSEAKGLNLWLYEHPGKSKTTVNPKSEEGNGSCGDFRP
jgi:hypothetical protein